jgi:hypothetical protein
MCFLPNAGYQAKPEYPLCTVEPKNQNIAEQWTCLTIEPNQTCEFGQFELKIDQ